MTPVIPSRFLTFLIIWGQRINKVRWTALTRDLSEVAKVSELIQWSYDPPVYNYQTINKEVCHRYKDHLTNFNRSDRCVGNEKNHQRQQKQINENTTTRESGVMKSGSPVTRIKGCPWAGHLISGLLHPENRADHSSSLCYWSVSGQQVWNQAQERRFWNLRTLNRQSWVWETEPSCPFLNMPLLPLFLFKHLSEHASWETFIPPASPSPETEF